MDVKNILEVLEGVKVIAVPMKAALKDGLSADDLPKMLEILESYKVLVEAVAGVGDIVDEVKDIDAAEATLIAAKVIDLIKSIKEA